MGEKDDNGKHKYFLKLNIMLWQFSNIHLKYVLS